MVARKRGHEELEASEPLTEPSLLQRLRNTWEFANLMQYIYIFGKAVKIDENLDIEDLEQECCKPEPSIVLSDIGLAMLKYVSSHRGLTPEIFDEYTRRQYVAKAPHRNPFGVEEEPKKFAEFDVFTKLKVLVQLSQWTLNNAERIREKLEERGEAEQALAWRMNEIGYDRHDRYYFVLDDNRLYRRTEAPLPLPPASKPKSNSKKAKAAARASKRRKTRGAGDSTNDGDVETPQPEQEPDKDTGRDHDDGFGGRKWECVAITLGQYQEFLESIKKSRDPDEKALHKRIEDEVMPVIEEAEASQLRKKQKQERELLNIQKLATAKRSGRLEAKVEKEREEREAREAEEKRKADLAEAQAYQKKQSKMEEDRESRMMTREQRIKDRELKRILHEQELARMSEEEKKADAGEARLSERHLKAGMEKKKKELAALQEMDEWTFDCSKCGQYGTNWDDGTHSVACEICNVWQHSACLGISQTEAEKDDFHFVCQDCRRRAEDAQKPKIPSLKFKVTSSSSPPDQKPKVMLPTTNGATKRKHDDNYAQQHASKKVKPSMSQMQPKAAQPTYPQYHTQNPTQHGLHPAPNISSTQGHQTPLYPPNQNSKSESPSKAAPAYGDGYNHLQHNGHGSQPPNQFFQPPPFMTNGYAPSTRCSPAGGYQAYQGGYCPPQSPYQQSQTTRNSQSPSGWSARYVPPEANRSTQSPHGLPPVDQNPFANTLNDYRPPSKRPASANGLANGLPSPMQNAPILSPPNYRTPSSSFNARPLSSSSASPQVNGFLTDNIAAHQPVGPPSQSPMKQASPPSTQSSHRPLPSSSPVAHQPALPLNGLSSPGFSPVKHASPQQTPLALVTGNEASASVLPPAPKLAPSPTQQNLEPSTKPVSEQILPSKPVGAQGNESK